MDDEYFPQVLAVVAYSTSKGDSKPDSEYDLDPEIQTIYTSQPIIAPLTNPTPIAQVHLLLDTYFRPIPVIALFDTGAAATILHSLKLQIISDCCANQTSGTLTPLAHAL